MISNLVVVQYKRLQPRGQFTIETKMRILYGAMRQPISLHNRDVHTISSVMDLCHKMRESSPPLWLEYHPGMRIALDSEERLEMAAEMVAEYHEAIKPTQADYHWLEDYGSIWVDDKVCNSNERGRNMHRRGRGAVETSGGYSDSESDGSDDADMLSPTTELDVKYHARTDEEKWGKMEKREK